MNDSKQEYKHHKLTRNLKWKIDDYKYLYKNTENAKCIESIKCPIFSNADPKELLFEWYFQLYPKAQTDNEKELSLFLRIENLKVSFVDVNAMFLIKDENGKDVIARKFIYKFDKPENRGYNELLPKGYIEKNTFNKTLTIEANIKFTFYHKTLPLTEDSDSEDTDNDLDNLPKTQISKDISVYLNKDVFSDVAISAGDQKYYAHKVILSARSSVFAAMFSHDFKENNENLVTVEESPTIFYQILEFIYSDKLPTKETVSEELYAAAHKYGLEEFQKECQILLENSINIQNVLKRLQCADLHNIDQLKKKVMIFIKKNFKDIIESKEWSALMSVNIKLVNEVLKYVHSKI